MEAARLSINYCLLLESELSINYCLLLESEETVSNENMSKREILDL